MARVYDTIGSSYATTRRSDPRIATAISDALGDAASVVNLGAGTGSYEPTNRGRHLGEGDELVAFAPTARASFAPVDAAIQRS